MIGKIASIIIVLKDHREGHGVESLPLLGGRQSLAGALGGVLSHHVVVTVVGDLGASPDPALLVQPVSRGGEHEWLHAKVELTVGFLAVDDVEAVGDPWSVVGDLEVEPLVVVRCVDVGIQQQVVLILTNLRIMLMQLSYTANPT